MVIIVLKAMVLFGALAGSLSGARLGWALAGEDREQIVTSIIVLYGFMILTFIPLVVLAWGAAQ